MSVHVTGGDRRHAQMVGQLLQTRIAPRVAALVGALQLDVERAVERTRELLGRPGIGDRYSLPRAARECDQPFGMLGDELDGGGRRQRLAVLLSLDARPRVLVG